MATTGEAEYEAELHRVRGEQLHALGDPIEASAAFRAAVDVATRTGATLFAAKAAAAWRALEPGAAEAALRDALAGLTLDVDEPDVVALREVATSLSATP